MTCKPSSLSHFIPRPLPLLLLPLLLLSATAALGLPELGPIPAREPHPLDDVVLRAIELSYESRFDEALDVITDGMAGSPRQGHLLRQLALTARDSGRLHDLATAIAGNGTFEPLPKDEVSRAFLAGIVDFYRGRNESAVGHFERALEDDPDWSWPRYYRARARISLGVSAEQTDPEFLATFADPEIATDIAIFLYRHATDARRGPEAQRYLDVLVSTDDPLYAHGVAVIQTMARLKNEPHTLEEIHEAWRELEDRFGARAGHASSRIASLVLRTMPSREALLFADERLKEGAPGHGWQWLRAVLLGNRGETTELRLELEKPDISASVLGNAGRILMTLDAAEGERLAERAWQSYASPRNLDNYQLALRSTGRGERADEIEDEGNVEHLLGRLQTRVDRFLTQDPERALALVDSLAAADAFLEELPDWRLAALDGLGQTEEVEHAVDALSWADRPETCGWLGMIADQRGDPERAEYWASRSGNAERRTSRALFHIDIGIYENRTARLEAWIDGPGADPQCPREWNLRWNVLAALERFPILLDELQSAPLDGDPEELIILADHALNVEETAVARKALEAARDRAGSWPSFRASEAALLQSEGDRDAASRIYGELAEEFPGYPSYQLAASATEVINLEALSDSQEGGLPPGLDPPDTSTNWILRSIAVADTSGDDDVIKLREEVTVVLRDRLSYVQRTRRTVLPKSDAGADEFRTLGIPFDPASGVPIIELARVVHPDGRVVEVPPSEILVSAVGDGATEVTDKRQVVIPFRELRPGSVADLVCRWTSNSRFGAGVAFSYVFGAGIPSHKEILEIRVPETMSVTPELRTDTTLSWDDCGKSRSATATDVDGHRVHRWEMDDMEPIQAYTDGVHLTEVYPWVSFSTFPSWDQAFGAYREGLWTAIEPIAEEIRTEAEAVTHGAPDDAARIDSLYRHVTESIDYLALTFGAGRIVPRTPIEVRERGYGDCKDMTSYLVALATSLGIESEFVLISVPPAMEPSPDFVSPTAFNHMIIRFPEENLFADPTAGRIVAAIPANLSGLRALLLPRTGELDLATIPEATRRDHGLEIEVDIRPLDQEQARYEVSVEYRGDPASTATILDLEMDPESREMWLNRILAFGAPVSSARQSWSVEERAGSRIRFRATYVDTAWSAEGANSAAVRYVTEVADPFLSYPTAEDRIMPIRIDYPFDCRATLRLHASEKWAPLPEVATTRIEGEFYGGHVESSPANDDGTVTIEQTFRLDRAHLTADEYRTFRDDWTRFVTPVNQYYRYRRVLEPDEVERLLGFAERSPEDLGFAIQAANRILGDDLGGLGSAGAARRDIARQLLEPIADREEVGQGPRLLLGWLAQADGRYLEADSIFTELVADFPGDVYVHIGLINSKSELEDWGAEAAAIEAMSRVYSDNSTQLRLITLYTAMEDQENSERAAERHFLFSNEADSTDVAVAQAMGHVTAERCEDSVAAIDRIRDDAEPGLLEYLEASLGLDCGNPEVYLEFFESAWEEDPVEPVICNNLAWAYAVVGQRLTRAEDLARASLILSPNESSRNTLAVVYARQGRWDEAKALLEEINANDDRPNNRLVNEYFIGICQYEMGEPEQARNTWEACAELAGHPKWRRYAQESMERADAGRSPAGAFFQNWDDPAEGTEGP